MASTSGPPIAVGLADKHRAGDPGLLHSVVLSPPTQSDTPRDSY